MLINKPKNIFMADAVKKIKPLLQYEGFYVLGIFTTLAIWHLDIIRNHPKESPEVTVYALCWGGILYLLWRNIKKIPEKSNPPSWFSSCLGWGLLFLVITRPLHLWDLDFILMRSAPIVAGLGLGLLSFGFSGFKQQWRLCLILCLMVFPTDHIDRIFEQRLYFNEITAAISAFLLHYIGFTVNYYGSIVKLSTGEVQVYYACTGGPLIILLMKLTFLMMLVVFPLTKRQRVTLAISAIGVGFFIGCIRVALLAIVVNNKESFDYWHGQSGGGIFITFATIIYALLCNWILPLNSGYSVSEIETKITNIQRKRRLFLAGTWLGIIVTAIGLIVTKKDIHSSISLPLAPVENLAKTQDAAVLAPVDIFTPQPAKNYSYIHSYQGKNYELEVATSYIVYSLGDPNPFLTNKSRNSLLDKQVKYLPDVGYFIIYNSGNKAYLTSCINVRGGGSVNTEQFMGNRRQYDLTVHRLLPWIFGQTVLRDHRCLWTQLSLSLSNQVSTDDIYPVLESVWLENYPKWQSLLLNHRY
jgi:cyanoexosortase A